MSQLKAFVGHSFMPEDEDVVRKYLKFFDQVKGMVSGFTWEHAEPAEPKVLCEKVRGVIKDKNLFIGICTNKEAAIYPDKLKRGAFRKTLFKAKEEHFSWKTSDWIIQEIGLAIGLGMDLILLLENGIRQPGGLQGDIEYIRFERNSPEKSFVKILEMIRALLPEAKATAIGEAEARRAPEEKVEPEKQETQECLEPKEDWSRRKYEVAMFRMVSNEDVQGAQRINEAYLASKEGRQPEFRESWEAFCEYIRIVLGKGGTFVRLEELAKAYSENSDVQNYLAMAYRKYDDYEKAAQLFEVAAKKAGSESEELEKHADAVSSLIKLGQKKEANAIISKMKKLAFNIENGEIVLANTLRELAESENDNDLFFGLSERLLQLRPDDSEERFTLAYKYSQVEQYEMSLFQYLKIPHNQRGAMAWNNLGVGLDRLNLAFNAVNAYRKAEELGETLAMSNFANKLINAGFLNEAQEICDRALGVEGYHKNVNHSIARIKDIPEEEENKRKEIVDRATPVSAFYREYGRAALQEDAADHSGRWKGPDCELSITIKGKRFLAEGSYDQPQYALALLGLQAPGTLSKMRRHHVRYEGKVEGRSVKCIFTRLVEGEIAVSRSWLGGADKGVDLLMILSESLREIKVYQREGAKERMFSELSRID